MTNDLKRRVYEHNLGKNKSNRPYRPWTLVYSESFSTRVDARSREKYLKSGIGREFLKSKLDP